MKRFLKRRLELAKALVNSDDAEYADIVLIITAVLSACASIRWPRIERTDRKRFIELLVSHSPQELHTSWVCIPALINRQFVSESDTPYAGGNATRIFRDDEIDLSLEDARTRYPGVEAKQLRKYCYASLIYEWLRCGYSHEYVPREDITPVPPSRAEARTSYIVRGMGAAGHKIMVSFHLEYLFKIAEHHVSILPDEESPAPSSWWADQA